MAALPAALLLVPILGTWAYRSGSAYATNPTLRPTASWGPGDIDRAFNDPALHWCGPHGHRWTLGPDFTCKGPWKVVLFNVCRDLPDRPWAEQEVIALLDHRRGDIAAFAAEVLGRWRCRRALVPLLVALDAELRSATPDVWRAYCAGWALAQLGDPRARPFLLAARARVGGRFDWVLGLLDDPNRPALPTPHVK